jgi:3',5'-cyclic-AMP phosphodiesterase
MPGNQAFRVSPRSRVATGPDAEKGGALSAGSGRGLSFARGGRWASAA